MRRWAADGVRAQMCVTSPPYFGLRDYGHPGQIGLEQTPEQYVAAMVEVFRCVRDVLADDGTLWLNIGDSYARNPTKGGSGPGGKNREWYGDGYPDKSGRVANGAGDQLPGAGIRSVETHKGPPPGLKEKDLIGIPWMLAFALRTDGWYLRQDIIWHKPNPMPESVTDRCTKAHEYVFLLSKSERYYFDSEAMKEPAHGGAPGNKKPVKGAGEGDPMFRIREGSHKYAERARAALAAGEEMTRNRRSVWTVATRPYKGAHFATFPPALIEPCILAGSRPGDVVMDPFMGSGTTAAVALQHGRKYLGCEINLDYKPLQDERMRQSFLDLEFA